MKILFVCNQARHRSKTAAEVFSQNFQTRYAGLYNNKAISAEDLKWSELVVVMEEEQRAEIGQRFPHLYLLKQIVSLDIPDVYNYQQQELIDLLKERFTSNVQTIL